jgi:hypothetical protein
MASEHRAMAEDIVTMFLFDFLTGNTDRLSGGNVGRRGPRGRLVLLDNDAAFLPLTKARVERQVARIETFRLLPRNLAGALRQLDPGVALGVDQLGAPLIDPAQIAEVAVRARMLASLLERAETGATTEWFDL